MLYHVVGMRSDEYGRPTDHGRSGPAVACLTAVREVLGSNHDAGSCVVFIVTRSSADADNALDANEAVPNN